MTNKGKGRPDHEMRKLYQIDTLRGWDVVLWDEFMAQGAPGGLEIVDVRVKWTDADENPILVVIRGVDHEGLPIVGFQVGHSLVEALASAARRIQNNSFKWREDEYRRGKHDGGSS